MLATTPPESMSDEQGRPYFLWDVPAMTLDDFRQVLTDPDPEVRAYWLGKLMRQAKPDDVFLFVSVADLRRDWERVDKHLGGRRVFWEWLLTRFREAGIGG